MGVPGRVTVGRRSSVLFEKAARARTPEVAMFGCMYTLGMIFESTSAPG